MDDAVRYTSTQGEPIRRVWIPKANGKLNPLASLGLYVRVGSSSHAFRAIDRYAETRLRYKFKLFDRRGGVYPSLHLYGYYGLASLSGQGAARRV